MSSKIKMKIRKFEELEDQHRWSKKFFDIRGGEIYYAERESMIGNKKYFKFTDLRTGDPVVISEECIFIIEEETNFEF